MMFLVTNPLVEVGSQLGGRLFSGILWFGIAFIIIAALGSVMWYFLIYKRKFNIKVKVFSERARGNYSIYFDNAAIIKDRKTKTKYLKLWSTKIEMPTPPYKLMQTIDKGDYLEILRTAENKFYYLQQPKIDNKFILKSDGKLYPIAKQKSRAIDPDMDYWAQKRKSANKGMFDPENIWMKIAPYIPIVMGGAIMIFMLYILMSYLPQILSELNKLVTSLNQRQVADVTTGVFQALIN